MIRNLRRTMGMVFWQTITNVIILHDPCHQIAWSKMVTRNLADTEAGILYQRKLPERTAELTGFAEALRWTEFSSLAVNGCVSCLIPRTLRELAWVSLVPGETLPWPTDVMTLLYCPKADFTSRFIMFFGHAGNAGNECDGIAA